MTTTPLQIAYIDPDGSEWDLSDLTMRNGYACAGISGIDGLPVSMQTTPLLDGTAFVNVYIPQPGTIAIGIIVGRPQPDDDENEYYRLLDRLVNAFYTRRNQAPSPGLITIQRPDGSTRQAKVFTTSGLDTPEVGLHYRIYSFTLQTPDPYWYDANVSELLFTISNATGILPLLPIRFASGTIIGSTSVVNDGGADAYPLWTITGPGTPTLTNNTTGRSFSMSSAIPSGNVVQINTQPGQQSAVNVTTGANIWDSLSFSSSRDLWALIPGTNQINIAMPGSTTGTTVGLTWRRRWLRA